MRCVQDSSARCLDTGETAKNRCPMTEMDHYRYGMYRKIDPSIPALRERIRELERQLANYQSARVRDVDEKAWLSKRMSYFEDQLRSLLSPAAFKAILDTAPQTETSAQRPGVP